MNTIIGIIVGIIAAIAVMGIIVQFGHDKISEAKEGNKANIVLMIILMVLVCVVVGIATSYLYKKAPSFSGWLVVPLVVLAIAGLMLLWRKKGDSFSEFLCFFLVTTELGTIAIRSAEKGTSAFLVLVAILVPILAVGFYAFSALKYQRDSNVLNDEQRKILLENKKDAEVRNFDHQAVKFNRLMAAVAAITLFVLAGTTGVVLGMIDGGALLDNPEEPTADAATEAVIPAEAEDILVKWTKKESNRIDSEFSDKLKAEAGDGEITPEIVKKVILEDCKDPSVLAIWGYKFGLYKDPNKYEPLMIKEDDKEKLSEEGVRLYNKVEGYLEAVSAEREEAPEDGTNTGYNDGFVVAEAAGISGDRTGTKMTCPNGEVFWVMDRCSNIVYKGNPPKDVPRGDTDEPTPPEKDPAEDPVNQGNAKKGGGQNRASDGSGETQDNDPRTETYTGSQNDNNHGHSNPATVTPLNPPATGHQNVVTDSNPMDYKPDPVTNNGPADSSKKPTSSEGDGEFTPSD